MFSDGMRKQLPINNDEFDSNESKLMFQESITYSPSETSSSRLVSIASIQFAFDTALDTNSSVITNSPTKNSNLPYPSVSLSMRQETKAFIPSYENYGVKTFRRFNESEVLMHTSSQLIDKYCDDESDIIFRDEFTRDIIGVTINEGKSKLVESIHDINAQVDPTGNYLIDRSIASLYHPYHPSWNNSSRISINMRQKDYIYGCNMKDKNIMIKLSSFSLKRPMFEPLFLTIGLYCITPTGFQRITESFHWNIPRVDSINAKSMTEKYQYLYGSIANEAYCKQHGNIPIICSIPESISLEDVYIVVYISKLLSGNIESSINPYLKQSSVKIDDTKHSESCLRLNNYRQMFGWGALRLLDEQKSCMCLNNSNVNMPIFAMRQAMNDNQLGSIIKELQTTSSNNIISKLKLEPLDLELMLDVKVSKFPLICAFSLF